MREHDLIEPEDIVISVDGYSADAWSYPPRCNDIDAALAVIREEIQEWPGDDLHGWWHRRPYLIALHNEVVRLRGVDADA
jgi:hypothetical protein